MATPTTGERPDPSSGRSRRPVLFLGLPMAVNVRDVLRSDAWATILEGGAEVHLFSAAAAVEAFRREFEGPSVYIHPLVAPRSRLFRVVDGAVLRLHVVLLSLRCATARIMIGETLRSSASARAVHRLLGALGRRGQDALLRLSRRLTRALAPDLYGDAFRRWRPDVVVGTRVVTMSGPSGPSSARYLDRYLLMAAADRGVPTMVLVSSWDNLTTSGFFPVEVDRITVWNEIMKDQAVGIHGLPPERVVVTGAPQHDVFASDGPYRARGAFFRELGLDPERRLVVYTSGTEGTIPQEPDLVARLAQRLAEARPDVQLLVRVHQLDDLERYAALRDRPGVALDQAGRPPVGEYHDRDFDRGQLERLADTLRHADVVVNAASSISIDAAAVGTPVVVVDFDAHPETPYHRSVRRFYDFTHQRPVVASGGVFRAGGVDALLEGIARYLEDPDADAEGRARLVREQCGVLDGGAGRRVGRAVLEALERSVARRRSA
ncbi:MAG: CDP-glycerol glycerophosphotransferase family protein [Gemmatimonadetes bacterium]|nr:CDP-glycerol glycerophosphotransferase family protein [Gemmatimonadota bacterium]